MHKKMISGKIVVQRRFNLFLEHYALVSANYSLNKESACNNCVTDSAFLLARTFPSLLMKKIFLLTIE